MSVDYTRVRTHRANGRVARIGRWIGAGILVLAALAVAQFITDRTPDYISQHQQYTRTDSIGSTIDARSFDVDVLGVRGAALLSAGTDSHDTSGVWIIVKARFTAVRNPATVNYAVLVDGDGRVYKATARVSQPIVAGRELQPGLPVTAEVAFEVPTAVATDLAVEFASPPNDDLEMDAVAKVHLPIDPQQVAQWAAMKQPAVLLTPKDAA